jgi:hypothetical protein
MISARSRNWTLAAQDMFRADFIGTEGIVVHSLVEHNTKEGPAFPLVGRNLV